MILAKWNRIPFHPPRSIPKNRGISFPKSHLLGFLVVFCEVVARTWTDYMTPTNSMHFSRANSFKLTIDFYFFDPQKNGSHVNDPWPYPVYLFFGMTTHGSFTSFRTLASKKDSTVRNSLAKLMPLELPDLSPIGFPIAKATSEVRPFLSKKKPGGVTYNKKCPVSRKKKNWTGNSLPFVVWDFSHSTHFSHSQKKQFQLCDEWSKKSFGRFTNFFTK